MPGKMIFNIYGVIHIEFNVKVTQSCATQFGKHIVNDSESIEIQMLFGWVFIFIYKFGWVFIFINSLNSIPILHIIGTLNRKYIW